jgi:hypothetical protein
MRMGVEESDRCGFTVYGSDPFSGIRYERMQRVRRYVAYRHIVVDTHAARCGSSQQDSAGFLRITGQQMLPQHMLYGRAQSDGLGDSLARCHIFTPLSSWDFVFDGILFFYCK